jgi:hypothetical protein
MKTYTIGGSGGFTLDIDGLKDDAYESTVGGMLAALEGLTIGKKLLNAIHHQCASKKLKIEKRITSSTALHDVCNANAFVRKSLEPGQGDYDTVRDTVEKEQRKGVAKGKSLVGYTPEEDPKSPVYDPRALGTGEGTDATIRFTPGVWAETTGECRQPGSKFQGPASTPEAILFHELIHAYRIMTGSQLKARIDIDGSSNQPFEEFAAILITNIHLSHGNATQLRSFEHSVHGILKAPSEFMTRNKNSVHVKALCSDLVIKPFLSDLAQVVTNFNPIAAVLNPSAR